MPDMSCSGQSDKMLESLGLGLLPLPPITSPTPQIMLFEYKPLERVHTPQALLLSGSYTSGDYTPAFTTPGTGTRQLGIVLMR